MQARGYKVLGLTCRDEEFAGVLGNGDVRMAGGELDAHLDRLVGHGCVCMWRVEGLLASR